MRRLTLLLATALLATDVPPVAVSAQGSAQRDPLSVMSFNIRYGTASDGENDWTARRQMLFDVVRHENADLVGLQEALDFQIREILTELPQYAVVGVGRDDGRTTGEYSAILFRKDRLHVAEAGTFWFSDTPAAVGSRSWGNGIPRICTWARFVDRDGSAFWHYNLHLDHQSQPSRERSSELLAKRIDERAPSTEPVIVTGDFNAGEDNPALRSLVAGAGNAPGKLVDTFRALYPEERQVGTFSGFKEGSLDGPKIDYVLVTPGTDVLSAAIVRTAQSGRYPSDHFPVTARVRLR
jgi:endonuclease/exonuclease/phosphatase family metal-dependent hydrolase